VLRGAVPVDGSGSLCPKVAIENGEVQRVDAVRAVHAVETRAASTDLLGVEVSHVPMIGALEKGAEHKGTLEIAFVRCARHPKINSGLPWRIVSNCDGFNAW
jgi:hypothetical protein